MIIGASDRMLTAGDIEFEPQQQKVDCITKSIAVMYAGDASSFVEVIKNVVRVVRDRIQKEPDNYWSVRDVAELHAQYYREICRHRAEQSVLEPRGLNMDSFIQSQRSLHSDFVRQISDELGVFSIPSVAAIYAGIDNASGRPTAQLYVVYNGNVVCQTLVGFAAIGIGADHAASEFMFAKHTPRKHLPETLILTYSAKKRAEAAPGVGEETDMVMVGPGLGQSLLIYDGEPDCHNTLQQLNAIYLKSQKQRSRITQQAHESSKALIEQIIARSLAIVKQSESTSASASPPPSSQSPTAPQPTEPSPTPSRPSPPPSGLASPPGSSPG